MKKKKDQGPHSKKNCSGANTSTKGHWHTDWGKKLKNRRQSGVGRKVFGGGRGRTGGGARLFKVWVRGQNS